MFDHDPTPDFILNQLGNELRLHGVPFDRGELETFIRSAWPWIEDEPGDLARWVAEFMAGRQATVAG